MGVALERAIAISAPFFAKRFLTGKVALNSILFFFVFTCILGLPALYVYELVPNATFKSSVACLPVANTKLKGILFVFISVFNAWTYSLIVALTVTIYLAFRILYISRARKHLQAASASAAAPAKQGISSREMNAAVTVFALAAVQTVVFIPPSIFWDIYLSAPVFDIKMPGPVATFMVSGGRVSVMFTQITHLWNFFLYYFRLPGFRKDLHRLFTCKRN